MSMTEAERLLNEAGSGEKRPSILLTEVGHGFKGRLLDARAIKVTEQDGTAGMRLLLEFELLASKPTLPNLSRVKGELPNHPEDKIYSWWIRPNTQPMTEWARAVKTANGGSPQLARGAEFSWKLIELRNTGRPQPQKIYAASYTPPVTTQVTVDDFDA